MKITIDCDCGRKLETSTVYDERICLDCGRVYPVPKIVATATPDIAAWMDPSGTLQAAGLMRVSAKW